MKVKKEVFESLRLELQEFAPQEFVATCWKATCSGSNNNNSDWGLFFASNTNHSVGSLHSGSHVVVVKSNSAPTSNGYFAKVNGNGAANNGNRTPGYIFNSEDGYYHFVPASQRWEEDDKAVS